MFIYASFVTFLCRLRRPEANGPGPPAYPLSITQFALKYRARGEVRVTLADIGH